MAKTTEQTATPANAATIVRKISTASVLGGAAKIREMADGAVMRIYGIMKGTETGEGDNGVWCAFKGHFQAVNLATGEVFASTKAFVPGAAEGVVLAAFEDAQEQGAAEMQFAFDIVKAKNDSSAVGYEYSARPLIKPEQSDPLTALANTLPAMVAIEAPKTDEKK